MAGLVWEKETTVLLCYVISAMHGYFYLGTKPGQPEFKKWLASFGFITKVAGTLGMWLRMCLAMRLGMRLLGH